MASTGGMFLYTNSFTTFSFMLPLWLSLKAPRSSFVLFTTETTADDKSETSETISAASITNVLPDPTQVS